MADITAAEQAIPSTTQQNGTIPQPSDLDAPKPTTVKTPDGILKKPFPAPRQSAPISRPPDTAQEITEANLSLEEQAKLAEEADTNGHTNGHTREVLMDLREEITGEPEKKLDAAVGEKRGRSEEPVQGEADAIVSAENGVEDDTAPEPAPEPELKKQKVEETAEVTDPTAPIPTDEAKPSETEVLPKKKAGRPKKEETKAVPGERKNSVSSRTRSKASAEDVSI
ncbi:hypothetical protein TWF481_001229 [Arthrobotrys musiformis]|uniref:Uncharacterized protein n=1 Tax=Arthrobotrys musiformis TaxID=47236 RepID=A0AAV9WW16_9PEZI